MLFLLIALVAVGLAANRYLPGFTLRHLDYRRQFGTQTAEIGQTVPFVATVENRHWLPVPFLRVSDQMPQDIRVPAPGGGFLPFADAFGSASLYLLPCQQVRREYPVAGLRRGRFRADHAALAAGDLLGMDTVTQDRELPAELVVLPRPADLDRELTPWGDFMGDISVRRWILEDPVLTVGVREYTGREPLRQIHWPSSRRVGRLMVKQPDFTRSRRVTVVLNVECAKPACSGIEPDKIEACISVARSLLEDMERAGIPFALRTDGFFAGDYAEDPLPGSGAGHLGHLLEGLGRMLHEPGAEFEALLEELLSAGETGTAYVLLMPVVLESYLEPISRLQRRTGAVSLIAMSPRNLDHLPAGMPVWLGGGGGE